MSLSGHTFLQLSMLSPVLPLCTHAGWRLAQRLVLTAASQSCPTWCNTSTQQATTQCRCGCCGVGGEGVVGLVVWVHGGVMCACQCVRCRLVGLTACDQFAAPSSLFFCILTHHTPSPAVSTATSLHHHQQGADHMHGCYGGTSALLTVADWVASPSWDGRLGLVVATDIAVYPPGSPARPTGMDEATEGGRVGGRGGCVCDGLLGSAS